MLEQRPLSIKEVKLLNWDLKRILKRKSHQLRLLVGWILIVIVVGTFFYFKFNSPEDHNILFGVALVYTLIVFWVFVEESVKLTKKQKSINFALSENVTNYIRVTTNSYIQLTEEEDEGVHYLFQLDNNRILSIGGQDFYPNSKFPNTDFEIVQCLGVKNETILLETYNYGKKLKPKIKISGKEKWDLLGSPNYPDPEKFTIISGRIEDYKKIGIAKV